ncbi:MAG: hypothetical protein IJ523_10485 [Succinivibrionaceae bacterium]|nr:hypothetical protein [Succinivibrionaceae bacterium]
MLTLPIKRKWFDMIASGEKLEEYRALTHYYIVRIKNAQRFKADGKWQFYVILRAGYNKNSPMMAIQCWEDTGEGKPEWGAEPGEKYIRLHITWKHEIKYGTPLTEFSIVQMGKKDGGVT